MTSPVPTVALGEPRRTGNPAIDLSAAPERADQLIETMSRTMPTEPFGPSVIDFCADFSRRLARAAAGAPELVALAFWMRRAELRRLSEEFARLRTTDTVLVPRGTVLHIPPANVDTIFVYSWLLSLLSGNKNLIRLSTRSTPAVDLILEVVADTFAGGTHASLVGNTEFVRYSRDQRLTATLSAGCDMRVIWGGDATVRTIRSAPLPPHAVELTFPDRRSLAVIEAAAYCACSDQTRDELVEAFFNDCYWFDQMACSSPRSVYWIGTAQSARTASADFYPRLQAVLARRGYVVDTSLALRKMTFSHQAVLDQRVNRLNTFGNELTVLTLEHAQGGEGEFVGGGTFFDVHLERLADLVPHIHRRDQTLSHFGFTAEQLRRFAHACNGAGLDRIVPVGQALTFNRYWDGHDLLQSFTRRIFIQEHRERMR
jgi:hypothetical protein